MTPAVFDVLAFSLALKFFIARKFFLFQTASAGLNSHLPTLRQKNNDNFCEKHSNLSKKERKRLRFHIFLYDISQRIHECRIRAVSRKYHRIHRPLLCTPL
jgi:hypothetical protein